MCNRTPHPAPVSRYAPSLFLLQAPTKRLSRLKVEVGRGEHYRRMTDSYYCCTATYDVDVTAVTLRSPSVGVWFVGCEAPVLIKLSANSVGAFRASVSTDSLESSATATTEWLSVSPPEELEQHLRASLVQW